jgi:hypothetical protein
MLTELALIPDMFEAACYSSPEACALHLSYLKDALLSEVLIRDLRNGDWVKHVRGSTARWHPRGQDLLLRLITGKRLRLFAPVLHAAPANDDQWCDEAIASHSVEQLSAILACPAVASRHKMCPTVHSVEDTPNSAWWKGRSPTVRPYRTVASYLSHLRLVLGAANSFMFIDPHIDPTRHHYSDFSQILLALRRPAVQPLIEVHRVCYEGSGPGRLIFVGARQAELEKRFRDSWEADLRAAGLSVKVFVWPDLHDRYLLTDLIGIDMNNGFDHSTNPQEKTTWSRMGRPQADEVQRDHDPAAARVKPHYTFQVP